MGKLLLRWIILAVSVWAAAKACEAFGLKFVLDVATSNDTIRFFIGVAILALLNATLGRILKFLTFPLNCLTLGLFSLVINAGMLMVAANLGWGFHLEGETGERFFAAFVGSLLISFINGILGTFLADDKDKDKDD